MRERNQQLDQARAQIKAECWDSMDVHRETVSALKAPLKVRSATGWACVWQCPAPLWRGSECGGGASCLQLPMICLQHEPNKTVGALKAPLMVRSAIQGTQSLTVWRGRSIWCEGACVPLHCTLSSVSPTCIEPVQQHRRNEGPLQVRSARCWACGASQGWAGTLLNKLANLFGGTLPCAGGAVHSRSKEARMQGATWAVYTLKSLLRMR